MPCGRVGLGGSLALAGVLAVPGLAGAQLTTTLDAGFSRVEYDGFLPSGAVSLTPALRFDHRTWSLAARGTYLRFESGNHSMQGLFTGTAYTAPVGPWRGELSAGTGASGYRDFPAFRHLVGRGRLHLILGDRGAWLSASAGQIFFGSATRPITTVGAGAWARRFPFTVNFAATHTVAGDTAYSDLEGATRLTHGLLEVEGAFGVRLWSRGAGRGVYGEATASVPLTSRFTVVIGAGRYPSDPTHGSVAGRYLSAGLRVRGLTAPVPRYTAGGGGPSILRLVRMDEGTREAASIGTDGHLPDAALELQSRARGTALLVIRAPWAQVVEVMGDFTDWEPVALAPRGNGTWAIALPVPAGVHHLNVRLDRGAWGVPQGAMVELDEFDGRVGTIVVP